MYFNDILQSLSRIEGITFRDEDLQCVDTYKYLGLIISSEGSIRKMEEDRVTKAKRASFAIRQALSTSQNVSVNLYMSLFDKQIEPILLYGCPIWGMPSSNYTIKVKGDNISSSKLRESLGHIFEFLGVTNIDIVSSRFYKKGEVANVTLGNIIDKITLLSHYYRSPVTFSIEPVEKKKDTLVETFYSTSCKHALGISKYSSTTLAMGELGRYPIQHRIILLTTMYWLRLEHGTKNPLLNLAYQTMKNENHQWCKNIEYYFWKIGYRNMWLNPEKWSKNTLKLSVKRRLQDMYSQDFQDFLRKDANEKKCFIANVCYGDTYRESGYLSRIHSPQIRVLFTKLRTDSNCSKDSRYRTYRGKKSHTDLCPHCNVTQDVAHILLHCNHPDIKGKRQTFLMKYTNYVDFFAAKSSNDKIKEILNLDPSCNADRREKATNTICGFVSQVYLALNLLSD